RPGNKVVEFKERTVFMGDTTTSARAYSEFNKAIELNPELLEDAQFEFKKLEEGDKENRELWDTSKKRTIEELHKIYEKLGVTFDVEIGESDYEAALQPLINHLVERGIAKESDGAIIVPLEKFNLPPALIRKRDEATLYLTRDIASLQDRLKEYNADIVLYVVDNGQSLHFQQLFAIAEITGLKDDFHHIKFGLVLGEDLKKLSTRYGGYIALAEIIDEAIKRARKVLEEKEVDMSDEEKEEVAKIVGIGALKYNDLSQNRMADIAFDWDKMLSLQGNSAPYLQYTYARLRSILRRVNGKLPKLNAEAIENEADLRLILKLAFFPEAVKAVSENYLPHQVANYLYDLARTINDYYEKEPILKAEENLRAARLNLVNAAAETMKTGLGLLGIKGPERM
ncbi:MAG: arginine--tRNA ligase, partial [Candidatus Colwellbacteria bacterium]|nr:arginine--tRNA ligase [Candidatus Colwellbacteria bacterium]